MAIHCRVVILFFRHKLTLAVHFQYMGSMSGSTDYYVLFSMGCCKGIHLPHPKIWLVKHAGRYSDLWLRVNHMQHTFLIDSDTEGYTKGFSFLLFSYAMCVYAFVGSRRFAWIDIGAWSSGSLRIGLITVTFCSWLFFFALTTFSLIETSATTANIQNNVPTLLVLIFNLSKSSHLCWLILFLASISWPNSINRLRCFVRVSWDFG